MTAAVCVALQFFSFVALTTYDRAFKMAMGRLRKSSENLKRGEAAR